MLFFRVKGFDRETGDARDFVIEARDREDAIERGNCIVESLEVIPEARPRKRTVWSAIGIVLTIAAISAPLLDRSGDAPEANVAPPPMTFVSPAPPIMRKPITISASEFMEEGRDCAELPRMIEQDPSILWRVEWDDRTWLGNAALHNRYECARILLAAGADPNQLGADPFLDAVSGGDAKLVKLFLAHGGESHISLPAAALRGDAAIVELLLANGVSVHQRFEKSRESALHVAASRGDVEIVKMLIAARADVNAQDWLTGTPLSNASYHKRTEVAAWIRASGGKTPRELEAEPK